MTGNTPKKGKANETDRLVGRRILMKRMMRGWTQEFLAHKLGITFQQLQKYENGKNRVAASRLYDLALTFNCSVDDFFIWPENRQRSVSVSFRFFVDERGRMISIDGKINDRAPLGTKPFAAYTVNVELIEGQGL